MYKLRRKILSQNFIYNRTLVKKLVRNSSIGFQDTVLEIGPGKGFITSELLQIAKKVIAVEIDQKLVLHLQKQFLENNKFDLYLADFLNFHLPISQYKVFANIPFSIEGKIIRKLIEDKNPPNDCYLVVRKDLAERLIGKLGNNMFFVKHSPWFNFEICYYFSRRDFIPNPSMDCVMLRITKKTAPLISIEEKQHYQKLIEYMFINGRPVKVTLRELISKEKLKILASQVGFSLDKRSGSLSLSQWFKLFWMYRGLYV